MIDFGRVLTAMLTPFREDGSLDLDGARLLARQLTESGSDGLVVGGTTGESPTLSHQEKLALFKAVKEEVGQNSVVIAGTGSNSTDSSIQLSREAEACGVDGLMLVVPYYNKPSQEGILRHFAACAGATSLPVMLYNIPGRTGINMMPETLARLSDIENIVALKESSGNMDQLSEFLRALSPRIRVYSGDDSLTLPMVAMGAYGVVSVASHLVGRELQEMVAAVAAGRITEAQVLHSRLFPLFRVLFIAPNPVPVKAALSLLGRPSGKPRLPLTPLREGEGERLIEILIQAGFYPSKR